MFVLRSTYNEMKENLDFWRGNYDTQVSGRNEYFEASQRLLVEKDTLIEGLRHDLLMAHNEQMRLIAKVTGYEKTYKIRTKPWRDSIGRLRDPKTGHCIKTPDPIKDAA